MIKIINRLVSVVLGLILLAVIAAYGVLTLSLPKLTDTIYTDKVSRELTVSRDSIGSAIVTAANREDAAYGLGYAHGQDRFFQMDLLRRNSAGELSAIFGDKAIALDEKRRFHQLRQRASLIFKQLPDKDKALLTQYTQGVNDALNAQTVRSFEYILTSSQPLPWQPQDSLLVIYSMYLDLQGNTINRDLALTHIQQVYGQAMVDFLIQPSPYQAALDGSELPLQQLDIPVLSASALASANAVDIADIAEVGSNNWAVAGALTETGHGMLSDDMHLSFAVPIIWYRAQLNYQDNNKNVQVTGVSLPGAPAIVVGSNNHVAWGFTNAYIDTADWVELSDTPTEIIKEVIETPTGEHIYSLEMSPFGPVVELAGKKYALSWVGHQPYAVDMALMGLEQAKDVKEAVNLAQQFGMPVQNLVAADKHGSIGWTFSGAVAQRSTNYNIAQSESDFDAMAWSSDASDKPLMINPQASRIWTANSRVVSAEQHEQYGDGGYALGARAKQIQTGLFAQSQFNEADFYDLQLDNQAQFLTPWHSYLTRVLTQASEQDIADFSEDIRQLQEWQACACAESVGYTLVRHFRTELLNLVFAPIETELVSHKLSLAAVKRYLEPAIWQIIKQQPSSWKPAEFADWDSLAVHAYQQSKQKLLAEYSDDQRLSDLTWGRVNALTIQHPFSKQIPQLSAFLDMPTRAGFGDSFMPAVQGTSFGASQRFIVQPGREQQAILTVPGGQSGHPLSDFYRSGFNDYVNQRKTPLLPSRSIHQLNFKPK